jgi:hypothetical protein
VPAASRAKSNARNEFADASGGGQSRKRDAAFTCEHRYVNMAVNAHVDKHDAWRGDQGPRTVTAVVPVTAASLTERAVIAADPERRAVMTADQPSVAARAATTATEVSAEVQAKLPNGPTHPDSNSTCSVSPGESVALLGSITGPSRHFTFGGSGPTGAAETGDEAGVSHAAATRRSGIARRWICIQERPVPSRRSHGGYGTSGSTRVR